MTTIAPKQKILLSWSGGKDSAMVLYEIKKANRFEVAALLTTITESYDRISMHGVRRVLLEQQVQSLQLPLCPIPISAQATNAEYEQRMEAALRLYQTSAEVSVVAFGDIFLEDLRRYRETNLAKLSMKGLFPIWKRNTRELAETFIDLGFRAILTCVDTKVLDESFSGRNFDRSLLADLPERVDPCGENGEFHSFVFDGPIFQDKINFAVGEKVVREGFCFCDLVPFD